MKKTVSAILFASLATASFASQAVDADIGKPLFKGSFSYTVSGAFNGQLGAGRFSEVGVFQSDGHGKVTADAIANLVTSDLSVALPSGHASYECNYGNDDFSPKTGMLLLHCTRHQSNLTPQEQTLDLVLSMVKRTPFVKIQAMSGGTFGNVQVTGEGVRAVH